MSNVPAIPASESKARRGQAAMWVAVGLMLVLVGFILHRFPPEQHGFYPRCVLHRVTGWQCPGCGGLRAAHALLHGNVSAAFALNPLLVLGLGAAMLIAAVHGLGRSLHRDWTRPLRKPWCVWLLVALVVLFGIGRNLTGRL